MMRTNLPRYKPAEPVRNGFSAAANDGIMPQSFFPSLGVFLDRFAQIYNCYQNNVGSGLEARVTLEDEAAMFSVTDESGSVLTYCTVRYDAARHLASFSSDKMGDIQIPPTADGLSTLRILYTGHLMNFASADLPFMGYHLPQPERGVYANIKAFSPR